MDIIQVGLKNHSMLVVETDFGIMQELSEYFSFFVPGYKFMPKFKNKKWDGKIRLFDAKARTLNVGLFNKLKLFASERHYVMECIKTRFGLPNDTNEIDPQNIWDNCSKASAKFKLRDYQFDAVCQGIKNKRTILLSPTGSGKSFIIYNLMMWYLQNYDKNILVVVPTTSLVEQMRSDFELYGFDVENNLHTIYSGKEKNTGKRIIVSTWQSIYKLPPHWFHQFGALFGDECHGFKSESLSSIMNKSINAEYRFGTTGTLDGTQTHKLVLEGLFGPVYKVTTTKKLQDSNTLAALKITVLLLKYKEETAKSLNIPKYQTEIDFLVSHDKRNNFIGNLAVSQKGNTLVLFNFVQKHGNPLYQIIRDKAHEKRKIFFVSGDTKTTDREAIRKIVEKQTDAIIVASLGTFSTGINIRNLHNIIFASPSKSQIRVLQSIGRGLRKSDNGETTKLFDIADDLHIGTKSNYTLLHSAERLKIYKKEEFPVNIVPVDIEK